MKQKITMNRIEATDFLHQVANTNNMNPSEIKKTVNKNGLRQENRKEFYNNLVKEIIRFVVEKIKTLKNEQKEIEVAIHGIKDSLTEIFAKDVSQNIISKTGNEEVPKNLIDNIVERINNMLSEINIEFKISKKAMQQFGPNKTNLSKKAV